MADLKIEALLQGVATGEYFRKVGSQFGSIWGFDGLTVVEATPEQYAAFGASRKTKLGHGQPLDWLGHQWLVILAYHRGELRQVNIHTEPDALLATPPDPRLPFPRAVSRPADQPVPRGRPGASLISVIRPPPTGFTQAV